MVWGKAQLAAVKPPSSKHSSIRKQEKSVVLASTNLGDAGIVPEFHRAEGWDKRWGPHNSLVLNLKSKLAILVETPGVYTAVRVHGEAMKGSSTHSDNLSEVKRVGTSRVQKAATNYLTAQLT